ncbi:response regulator transcription factor [Paenibacillus aquistagni]|uniref:response regulator transcription factor n=1 Tax=Paenibacillus aquistagni TaxID=1852522 RepID=UPI000B50502D|nr:response regulator [Paenibacillus aquistagni]NMM53812.1 response regulator [Paenibacillus aquistagni]
MNEPENKLALWRVLLIDDEEVIRRGLKGYIEASKLPFAVVGEAETAAEAVRQIEECCPDVVFVDINMPDMNGLDMIRSIQLHDSTCISVVISGYDHFEYVRQALQLKVFDYLLKPVPKSDLYALLKKLDAELQADLKKNRDDLRQLKQEQCQDLLMADGDGNDPQSSGYVLEVQAYIEAHYTDKELSLQQVAQLFHLNKSYLSTRMKQEIGCSFNEYVTELRMKKAKELLSSPFASMRMSDVARKIGYSSQYYFSRVFKLNTGKSPLEYRQQFRRGQ